MTLLELHPSRPSHVLAGEAAQRPPAHPGPTPASSVATHTRTRWAHSMLCDAPTDTAMARSHRATRRGQPRQESPTAAHVAHDRAVTECVTHRFRCLRRHGSLWHGCFSARIRMGLRRTRRAGARAPEDDRSPLANWSSWTGRSRHVAEIETVRYAQTNTLIAWKRPVTSAAHEAGARRFAVR